MTSAYFIIDTIALGEHWAIAILLDGVQEGTFHEEFSICIAHIAGFSYCTDAYICICTIYIYITSYIPYEQNNNILPNRTSRVLQLKPIYKKAITEKNNN